MTKGEQGVGVVSDPVDNLLKALRPFQRAADDQATRPYAEDGHVVGPGGLTVADWRALDAALPVMLPVIEAARWVVAAGEEDEGGEWNLSHEELVASVKALDS